MSSAPNLGFFLHFIQRLDQGIQANQDQQVLLEQSLNQLVNALSSLASAAFYDLRADAVILSTTSANAGVLSLLVEHDFAEQILASGRSVEKEGHWFSPIYEDKVPFGLLISTAQADHADATLQQSLDLLAYALSQALGRVARIQHRQIISERRLESLAGLDHALSFDGVVEIVSGTMLADAGGRVQLYEVLYSETASQDIEGLRLLSASPTLSAEEQESLSLISWSGINAPLRQALMAGEEALVDDFLVENAQSLGGGFYRWAKAQEAQGLVLVPVMIDGALALVLAVISDRDTFVSQFSQDYIDALKVLADRIGWTTQVRDLLETTHRVREIADNLVLSNRLITTSENLSDMAQAAIYTVAKDMLGVIITLFENPVTSDQQFSGRGIVAIGLPDGPLELTDQSIRLEGMLSSVVLETLRHGQPVTALAETAGDFASVMQVYAQQVKRDLGWLAVFGLRDGDRLIGTLEIVHDSTYTLSPEQIDAYTTLSDQLSAVIRNRQLLHETTLTLEQVQMLYAVNSLMLAAQDIMDVLRVFPVLMPNASALMHSTAEYDSMGKVVDIVTRNVITEAGEQNVEIALSAHAQGTSLMSVVQAFWEQPVVDIIFVEDADNPPANFPIELVNTHPEYHFGSLVIIPIYERLVLTDIIRVGYAEPQIFNRDFRRMFDTVQAQVGIVLQNLRLLHETQVNAMRLSSQVHILEIINDMAMNVSTLSDEQELLDASCKALVEALGIAHAGVVFFKPDSHLGVVRSEYPLQGMIGNEVALTGTDEREVFYRDLQPVAIQDVENSDLLLPSNRKVLTSVGIGSMLLVPFADANDNIIGSIGLDAADKHHFTPELSRVAQTITSQISVGLQNIHLLNNTQRQAEQLRRVSEFGQTLQSTLDLETIVQSLLVESQKIINMDYIDVAIYDTEEEKLRRLGWGEADNVMLTLTGGTLYRPDQPIIEKAWKSQQLFYIADNPRAHGETGVPLAMRSLVVLPMHTQGKNVGVLRVAASQPNAYTETDTAVLQQIAGLMATAVENTQAFTYSLHMAENEVLANEIATRLQQQVDVESMLNVTVQELGKALGAKRGRIRLKADVSGGSN
jgi:GAF domain-containing protein